MNLADKTVSRSLIVRVPSMIRFVKFYTSTSKITLQFAGIVTFSQATGGLSLLQIEELLQYTGVTLLGHTMSTSELKSMGKSQFVTHGTGSIAIANSAFHPLELTQTYKYLLVR